MISRLTGVVAEKKPPSVVIDVQGVGYEVFVSMNNFDLFPEMQETVVLHIEHIVREDSQTLYGFLKQRDRELFRLLLKVNGVGAKIALGILSAMSSDMIVQSVKDKDTVALVKLPGIGKKTAERLVIELQDRLADWWPELSDNKSDNYGDQNLRDNVEKEAMAALVSLGYKPKDASKAVDKVMKTNEVLNSESLIRAALQYTM
jgi:holliday junction DNA helicase RuvA